MQTNLISLQFALFFKDVISRPDVTFSAMNDRLLNLFDGMPSVLPIPLQAPPDVPIMMLRSEQSGYLCNISRVRVDLMCEHTGDDKSNDEIFKDFNAKVRAFSAYVLEQAEVVRFGLIARYFRGQEDSPVALKKKYFTRAIGDVAELGLRFNAKSSFEGWDINDLVEISSGVDAVINGALRKGILIQRDINNTPSLQSLNISTLEKLSSRYAKSVGEDAIKELLP